MPSQRYFWGVAHRLEAGMHPLLVQACAQADQAIVRAARRPVSPRTGPSEHADLASPAPRVLHVDAEDLCGALELSQSWLAEVRPRDGFLNFTLAPGWYAAAAAQPTEPVPLPVLPPVSVRYPAKIHPFDWHFLTALRGREPDPALAARQDRSNAGALVRLTLKRLEQVEGRCPEQCVWTREERRLLLLLCRWEEDARPKRRALFLERLAGEVWTLGPLNIPGPLSVFARGVLSQGCASLLRSTDGVYSF